jgi:hypothetical protein
VVEGGGGARGGGMEIHSPPPPPDRLGYVALSFHTQMDTPKPPGQRGYGTCQPPACDCGTKPCGFYVFNHSSDAVVHGQSFQDWFINSYMLNQAGLSPLVSGFYWCGAAVRATLLRARVNNAPPSPHPRSCPKGRLLFSRRNMGDNTPNATQEHGLE